MAHLRGSSESAEELRRSVRSAAEALTQLVTGQLTALNRLAESCRDDSYEDMKFVTNQTTVYIKALLPQLAQVHSRLAAYRDLIESLDKGTGMAFSETSRALAAKGYDAATQAKWVESHRSAAVMQAGESWSKGLTQEQKAALHSYTGGGYTMINPVLRGQSGGFTGDYGTQAANLEKALQNASVPCDCVVYRGVGADALGKYQHLSDQELEGKIYTDNGFMSTSVHRKDSFGGKVLLEIEVPKGANGAYVGYIGQQGHAESELLFNRGQYMKFIHVRRDPNGRRIIRARMMKKGPEA